MITSYDKFILALVGAVAFALNTWTGWNVSPDTVNQIITIATAGGVLARWFASGAVH